MEIAIKTLTYTDQTKKIEFYTHNDGIEISMGVIEDPMMFMSINLSHSDFIELAKTIGREIISCRSENEKQS